MVGNFYGIRYVLLFALRLDKLGAREFDQNFTLPGLV